VTTTCCAFPRTSAKTAKAALLPLLGELADIIASRKAARAFEEKGKPVRLAEFIFHKQGQRVLRIRRARLPRGMASGYPGGELSGPLFPRASAVRRNRTHGRGRVARSLDEVDRAQDTLDCCGRYQLIKPDKQMTAGFELLEQHRHKEQAKAKTNVVAVR